MFIDFDRKNGKNIFQNHIFQKKKEVVEKEKESEPEAEAEAKNDPLFCEACDKKFAKETVFNSHLTGRKHKRCAAVLSGK